MTEPRKDSAYTKSLRAVSKLLDDLKVFRRGMLMFTAYLTWFCYTELFDWVKSLSELDVAIGVIVTAFIGPITTLQGFALNFYTRGRFGNSAGERNE